MNKTFVLDTNVVLQTPHYLFMFEDSVAVDVFSPVREDYIL